MLRDRPIGGYRWTCLRITRWHGRMTAVGVVLAFFFSGDDEIERMRSAVSR